MSYIYDPDREGDVEKTKVDSEVDSVDQYYRELGLVPEEELRSGRGLLEQSQIVLVDP